MLKCKDVAERSSDYLDGKLSWLQRLDWYLHLFLCGPCRRFIRHFKISIKVSRSIAANSKLPQSDADALAQKIEASCQPPPE